MPSQQTTSTVAFQTHAQCWGFRATIFAFLVGCFFLIQPEQFVRPFIYADDLMWDVDPHFYVTKLSEEGRWLVFGWMRTFGFGSAAFDYKIMLILWCATTLLLAFAVLEKERTFLLPLFAAALALNPSLWALTYWPHSTLPMTAILCIGAFWIALARNEAAQLRALFFAMVATALSYQLFSFYLLGGVLVAIILRDVRRRDEPGLSTLVPRLAILIATGVAGMIAGVLVQFSLNFVMFRHFGLASAKWRAEEAAGLATNGRAELVIANLQANLSWMNMVTSEMLVFTSIFAVTALATLFFKSSKDSRSKLAIGLFVLTAVAVAPLLIPLVTGVALPGGRGSLNLWLSLVAITALPIVAGINRTARALGSCGLLILILGTFQSLSRESAARASSSERNQSVLDQLDASVRSTGVVRPAIFFVGKPNILEIPGGEAGWYTKVLLRHRFKGRAESLSFCATPNNCRGTPFGSSEMVAMPVFPAPAALKQKGRFLLLKLGPMKTITRPANLSPRRR